MKGKVLTKWFKGFLIFVLVMQTQLVLAQQILPFNWAGGYSACPANRRPRCERITWIGGNQYTYTADTYFDNKTGMCRTYRHILYYRWNNFAIPGYPSDFPGISQHIFLLPVKNISTYEYACDACSKQAKIGFSYVYGYCECVVKPKCPDGLIYNPVTRCCESK